MGVSWKHGFSLGLFEWFWISIGGRKRGCGLYGVRLFWKETSTSSPFYLFDIRINCFQASVGWL